jgi:hypothetical protein
MKKEASINHLQHQDLEQVETIGQNTWYVHISQVKHEHINAILGIIGQATKKDITEINEEDFRKMREIFLGSRGLVEQQITKGSSLELEWRRYPTPDGYYVRFRPSGIREVLKASLQQEIDAYLISEKIAKSLSAIS